MIPKKFTRCDYISSSRIRITMNAAQRTRQFHLIAVHEKGPNGFDRVKSHPGRTPSGEETKDHFFPERLVVSVDAHFGKLSKAPAYLGASRLVCLFYILDRYLLFDFHRG